jgi:hypothetical protein
MSDFREVVEDKNWQRFEKYMETSDKKIEDDLEKSLKKREEYRKYLIEDKKLREIVAKVNEKQLSVAEQMLYQGNVSATDGTLCTFPLLSGVRCRIGVVATSYKNNTIEKVLFVSEREFVEKETSSAKEHFELLEKGSGVSSLFLQGIMSFKEREIALNRTEEWKFIHGHLVPMELRVPRLGPGAFDACLELAKKIIDYKKCIGVISGSTKSRLTNAGIILESGEYMFANYVSTEVKDEIEEAIGNKKERRALSELVDKYLAKIKIGVFRVGPKPYIFEAHEDSFDEAASLIIRDSLNQSLRGFPLLIDYADSICKHMLGPDDFSRAIEHKLAKKGGYYGFGFDMPERLLRRRG